MTELTQPWRKALRALHIAISVAVIGADLAIITLGFAGMTGGTQGVYPAAQLIGSRVVLPLAIAALATGVALALLTPYGLLRYWWVTIKLSITAALNGLVLFFLVPALGAAADAAAAGVELSDARRLALVLAPVAGTVLLLVNVALAIFKPGGRIGARWRRVPQAPGAAS